MRPWIAKLALATLAVLAPIRGALLAAAVLVAADLVSGIAASVKRKEPVKSNGIRRTLAKILVYELVIVLGFIVEAYMFGELFPIVKILAGMIGLAEFKSVLENLEDITGMPLLKTLIDKLTGMENQ